MRMNNHQLQFITHYNDRYSYIDSARIALEGGCRWIQLRMKGASEELLEATALTVQKMCKEYGATFIIDDNVALTKRIGADGVHLGKSDMPIAEARQILGNDFIIGGTVNTFEDILKITNCLSSISLAQQPTVNYFGCGPFRFTQTKQKLSPILGIEGYLDIVKKKREHNIDIPIVAIGGICKDDIPGILDCGIDGIALSGSVLRAENPIEEMKDIVNELLTNNLKI